jgi:hypothetical protein
MNVDAWQADLREAGWSIGDMAILTPAGLAWMVFGQCGDERIVAKAPTQADAWREAARMALRIEH